ncbi:MAG: DUF2520 domain-containing protein [Gemmatimonadales bacterium]|nr:DUF2520 domain-containing protein [Gemmatimonadales bacterium]
MPQPRVTIVGAGRMGQGLALALLAGGHGVTLASRRVHPVSAPLALHSGSLATAAVGADSVILAVPDEAISRVAGELAAGGTVAAGHVVLHLSGLLDRSALLALAPTGAALGSFHPLQTIADPATAAERLAGAFVGIEGDERALARGELLAAALNMTPVRVGSAAKAAYHAGAAMAANYTVALAGVAERLAREAGIPAAAAARIFLPLVRGAVANLDLGPAAALTGPVRRGDARTVQAHLEALGPNDRMLYRGLGLEALRLAREAGLDEAAAARVEAVLREEG